MGLTPRILMCRPTYFQVNYVINEWMNINNKVDTSKAMTQWRKLRETIRTCGATVETMEPWGGEKQPDLVFTANAALIRGKRAYMAKFRHPERRGEEVLYQKWFHSHGFKIYSHPRIFHEGSGDALWGSKQMRTLFTAIGQRSDQSAINDIDFKMNTPADPIKIHPIRLIDPRFYHLDTCLCPLNDEVGLYFPKAFDPPSIEILAKHMELITVSEKEACNFACNAVVIGKNVIMHDKNEETAKILESKGFNVHFVDMSEFIKGGGSAKCCTLRIG